MEAQGFYVSIIDGERKALVLGPFPTHSEALARVDEVSDFANGNNPDGSLRCIGAPFWGYGTAGARMPFADCPAGKWNAAFGM